MTDTERAELRQLLWTQRYYCDMWLANMKVLDLMRPALTRLHARQVEIVQLLDAAEMGMDEAEQKMLGAMREWWLDYKEVMACIKQAPN